MHIPRENASGSSVPAKPPGRTSQGSFLILSQTGAAIRSLSTRLHWPAPLLFDLESTSLSSSPLTHFKMALYVLRITVRQL
jgi:hypothetical protein